jgi:hypothetical protein
MRVRLLKVALRRQEGQAAVETALAVPGLVFALLGVLQIALAYQARIVAEYAAYKAARAASVYRLDCERVRNAALVALAPTIGSGSASGSVEDAYVSTLRQVLEERPNQNRVGNPHVRIDYVLENRVTPFDTPLEPGEDPMRVRIRLTYYYELRIPFANYFISQAWLAQNFAGRSTRVQDPSVPGRTYDVERVGFNPHGMLVANNADRGLFTLPVVTSWTLRMMSDPLPGTWSSGSCL